MKLNFKARIKNKTFIISVIALVLSFLYKLLSIADIVPAVSENELLELCGLAVNILALAGVVVDPTTKGISDSERAMSYYMQSDEVKLVE
jgi:phi LC3 family holin